MKLLKTTTVSKLKVTELRAILKSAGYFDNGLDKKSAKPALVPVVEVQQAINYSMPYEALSSLSAAMLKIILLSNGLDPVKAKKKEMVEKVAVLMLPKAPKKAKKEKKKVKSDETADVKKKKTKKDKVIELGKKIPKTRKPKKFSTAALREKAEKNFRKDRLVVGDVFVSKLMANNNYGYQIFRNKKAVLDKNTLHYNGTRVMGYRWTEKKDGFEKKHEEKIKLRPSVKTRKMFSEAQWVVVATELSGGGTGHGPNDVYPDGWGITAKMLVDGKWDEASPEVFFRQSGCFTDLIDVKDIEKVGKMKMVFVAV